MSPAKTAAAVELLTASKNWLKQPTAIGFVLLLLDKFSLIQVLIG